MVDLKRVEREKNIYRIKKDMKKNSYICKYTTIKYFKIKK